MGKLDLFKPEDFILPVGFRNYGEFATSASVYTTQELACIANAKLNALIEAAPEIYMHKDKIFGYFGGEAGVETITH